MCEGNDPFYTLLLETDAFIAHGEFKIKDVFPRHGPMGRDQKMCIETQGPLPKELKETFLVRLNGNQTTVGHEIKDLKRNGNYTTFVMPTWKVLGVDVVVVDLTVEYDHEEIYRTTYAYSKGLEGMLFPM